jgi:hypothetical protein
MQERARSVTVVLLLVFGIGLVIGLAPGCAKKPTAGAPGPPREALVVVETYRDELPDQKVSVKLVVRGDATPEAATELLRQYVDEHQQPDEEMWVGMFLEGMDLQSVEYAIAIARPGAPPWITVRESLQTYR